MGLAVVGYILTRSREACPQSVERVGLILAIAVGNRVTGFTNGSGLTVAFLVHPTNEDMVCGSGLAIGNRKRVTLGKAVVEVPLHLLGVSGLLGRGPRCTIEHQVVASLASLLLIGNCKDILGIIFTNSYCRRTCLAVGIALDLRICNSRLLYLIANLVTRNS